SGPNTGKTGSGTTNAGGQATFTYASTAAGTDTIVASFVNSQGQTTTSNAVTKTWTAPQNRPPVFDPPTPADGTVLNVVVGQNLTFPVNASDPDAGDTVALAIANQPAAATFA